MQMSANVPLVEVRLVLIAPRTRNVAVIRNSKELPRVQIAAGARFVPALQSAISVAWGLRVFVLRRLSGVGASVSIVAAELCGEDIPKSWELVGLTHALLSTLPEAERHALEQLIALPDGSKVGAIGWNRVACAWAEDTLKVQMGSDCPIEQYDGGDTYALLRLLDINGKAYWLKATDSFHRHELAITSLLDRLGETSTPRVLAVHAAWNAWLMLEDGTPLQQLPATPDELTRVLGSAVRSLAKIQLNTLADSDRLFAAGAIDQRLERLQSDAHRLFQYIASASRNDASRDPVGTSHSLSVIEATFVEACDRALELTLPVALLHGDLNLGNLAFSARGCRILDWSESYMGFPQTSLQHLLLLNPIRDCKARCVANRQLEHLYQSVMSEAIDNRAIAAGLQLAPMIAAASALYGRGDWGDAPEAAGTPRHTFARIILHHLDAATSSLLRCWNGGLPC